MSAKSGLCLSVCLSAFVVGGAIHTFVSSSIWLNDKIRNQDNLIKKAFSRLKEKEEQIKELSSRLSALEDDLAEDNDDELN